MRKNLNVIFFDGVCNLCNSTIQFLIRVDKKRTLKYASLQSDYAKKKLSPEYSSNFESVVFLKDGKEYAKSRAVVMILRELGGFYKFLGFVLSIFPYSFLNFFYNKIAKNRYKMFGKKDNCMIPTEEQKELFVG